ncbi:TPA: hypothetical protein QFF52_002309 [Enterococcus faecium]
MKDNRLIIKNVQLFLTAEKKAKKIEFTDGVNILTSNQRNGNKVGKSLILKSIYHALGAESHLDKVLLLEKMVFIVQFNVSGVNYSILRSGSLFKLFDAENELIVATESASKLAKILYDIYGFSVYLPSRNEKKLEIAPPAFAYMLNYIDQDHMHGSSFDSFRNLSQFINYKENLLYCHFGLFDQNFFELTTNKDKLSEELRNKNDELNVIGNMLDKIKKDIPKAVPENVETLRIELNRREDEYRKIYSNLKKIKDKLIRLRNSHAEILFSLENVKYHKRIEDSDLRKIMKEHTCPLCRQDLHDTLEIRVIKNINLEDLSQTSLDLQKVLLKTEKDIEKEEETYYKYSNKLKEYKKILRGSVKNQDEIIKMQGYSDLQAKLNQEWSAEHNKVLILKDRIKFINEQLDEFKKKKSKVNASYYQSMKQDIIKFGLEEITDKSIQNIRNVVSATGSNTSVITIVWYFNLLKLKNEFNPEAIKFPIILDSPNHGELDDEKKGKLFEYLFNNIMDNSQCIISTLGFKRSNFDNDLELNIINLDNPSYQLLTPIEYEENREFLELLIEK